MFSHTERQLNKGHFGVAVFRNGDPTTRASMKSAFYWLALTT
jgi:hypothetical protein